MHRQVARSKVTGRFAKTEAIKRRPDIIEAEIVPLPREIVLMYRSKITGRFVKKSTWKRNRDKYDVVEFVR